MTCRHPVCVQGFIEQVTNASIHLRGFSQAIYLRTRNGRRRGYSRSAKATSPCISLVFTGGPALCYIRKRSCHKLTIPVFLDRLDSDIQRWVSSKPVTEHPPICKKQMARLRCFRCVDLGPILLTPDLFQGTSNTFRITSKLHR